MRKTLMLLFVLAIPSYAQFNNTDHSSEYKTGKLLSWRAETTGQDAEAGALGTRHSYNRSVPVYRVQLGDVTYDLRPDAGNTKDLEVNPLSALQPNQDFKYRIDQKGNVWVPAPMFKRGKPWKPYHEAKYNVWGQS